MCVCLCVSHNSSFNHLLFTILGIDSLAHTVYQSDTGGVHKQHPYDICFVNKLFTLRFLSWFFCHIHYVHIRFNLFLVFFATLHVCTLLQFYFFFFQMKALSSKVAIKLNKSRSTLFTLRMYIHWMSWSEKCQWIWMDDVLLIVRANQILGEKRKYKYIESLLRHLQSKH